MKRGSKLFLLLSGLAFLAALAWALVTQTDLVLTQRNRPAPKAKAPAGEEAPKAEEGTTGVVGTVDEATRKAIEKNLKAEAEARKRLDR